MTTNDWHLRIETPGWDTKIRCSCGAAFASKCEFWSHQAQVYEVLARAGTR